MVLHGTINVYGLGYGCQDTMNFIFLKCLFSTPSASIVVLRAFWAMLINFLDQLYDCQVTLNSIYGLDMVAKKGLWSTRESRKQLTQRQGRHDMQQSCILFVCTRITWSTRHLQCRCHYIIYLYAKWLIRRRHNWRRSETIGKSHKWLFIQANWN